MPYFWGTMKGMNWRDKEWTALGRDELYAILRLRVDVFVLEQDCPYSELDGKDLRAIHVFACDGPLGKGLPVAACTRVLGPGVSYAEPSIGRVATRRDLRGKGLGREVMLKSMEVCMAQWPGLGIRISAQCYLEAFYKELGFEPAGETYLEDGIPHVQMLRPAAN